MLILTPSPAVKGNWSCVQPQLSTRRLVLHLHADLRGLAKWQNSAAIWPIYTRKMLKTKSPSSAGLILRPPYPNTSRCRCQSSTLVQCLRLTEHHFQHRCLKAGQHFALQVLNYSPLAARWTVEPIQTFESTDCAPNRDAYFSDAVTMTLSGLKVRHQVGN